MESTITLSVVRIFFNFCIRAASVLALVAAPSALAQREYMIPLLLADGDPFREGFARIINHSVVAGSVSIVAIDDEGTRSSAITLSLPARGAVHFNSGDLESGNPAKGLAGGVGDGVGDWRLQLTTDLEIEPLAYIRTRDGFLTSVHEIAPLGGVVPIFNPASNDRQRSLLRVINPTDSAVSVWASGRDDSGKTAFGRAFEEGRDGGYVTFDLQAGAARTLTAQELEAGGEGFDGALEDGVGKWQLVFGDAPILAMSLLESPTQHLTNLSTLRAYRSRTVPLMLSDNDPAMHGFIRIVNVSDESGTVEVRAIDDSGKEVGPVTLPLEPRQARHFNSRDLETGAPAKGIAQGLGSGTGNWRLEFSSNLWIDVSAFVRTKDGFVTSMHDVGRRAWRSQETGQGTEGHLRWRYHLPTFNPASNTRQRSLLRLVNPSNRDVEVEIEGIDDSGSPSLGKVRLTLAANESKEVSSLALERGEGLHGMFGDGKGKWQLYVSADGPVFAQSLMRSADGQLTNLSRTYLGGEDQAADSYKLNWTAPDSRAGNSVAPAGDFDGDGLSDLLVGVPAGDSEGSEPPGSAYLFLGSSLSRLDSGSGLPDGQIELGDSLSDQGAWQFVGEADASEAGASVASASDGNGRPALLVGSPGFGPQATRAGAAYFISGSAPAAADAEDGGADGVVSLSHIAAQPGSWKFVGEAPNDVAGASVAAAGDVDGDGVDDILIGAPGERPDDTDEEVSLPGAFYLASGAALAQADQSDGQADGVIELGGLAQQPNSWKFVGEHDFSWTGVSLASAGDVNGDGRSEVLVGAPGYDGEQESSIGAAYLISPSDLASMDAADGTPDGVIDLANVAAQPRSWKFTGADVEDSEDYHVGQSVSSAGDIDGDGRADLLIGRWDIIYEPGPIYLITAAALPALDAEDGRQDGTIDLRHVGSEGRSWRLEAKLQSDSGFYYTYPSAVASAGDVDGDGLSDILVGTQNGGWPTDFPYTRRLYRAAFLISARDLALLDAEDGDLDGTIDLDAERFEAVSSWQFVGEGDDDAGSSVASAGDVNGDGLADLLIGANQSGVRAGAAYVLSATDLNALDLADGRADGYIRLGTIVRNGN